MCAETLLSLQTLEPALRAHTHTDTLPSIQGHCKDSPVRERGRLSRRGEEGGDEDRESERAREREKKRKGGRERDVYVRVCERERGREGAVCAWPSYSLILDGASPPWLCLLQQWSCPQDQAPA